MKLDVGPDFLMPLMPMRCDAGTHPEERLSPETPHLEAFASSCLGEFAPQWDALVEALAVPSPFLRSWWLGQVGGGRPVFLFVVEGGLLVGGLALEEDRKWTVSRLRVLGADVLCPDHLDCLAAPGREQAVVQALAGWLGRKGSRVIDLEGLVAEPLVKEALPKRRHEETMDVAPWASLPCRFGEYLESLSPSLRKTVRTASRRMNAADVSHSVIADADGVQLALRALKELHSHRWEARSRFLSRFDDFAAAACEGASRGEMVFHQLASNTKIVGVLASFEVAGRASLYQWGRDPDPSWGGLGSVLLMKAFERSCGLGLSEVDLLRGNEPYKLRFAPNARRIIRLRSAHGLFGQVVLTLLLLESRGRQRAHAMRSTLQRLIASRGVAERRSRTIS